MKGALINLVSIGTLLCPPLLILYFEEWKKILLVWGVIALMALFYPPIGWLRPHRHSDNPNNRQGGYVYND